MSWPDPVPGLVIRYSYLWAEEARAGREEGVKDRPCAIILVVQGNGDGRRVLVVPITHSPPADLSAAIEIPAATKRRLGLDSERSWIVLSEYNAFRWPGPDLRMLPGHGPESTVYGHLPPGLLRAMLEGFVRQVRLGRAVQTSRTE